MHIGPDEFIILLTNKWLNNKIVDFYFCLIQKYARMFGIDVFVFSSFFYTSLAEQGFSWVRRCTRYINIFRYDYIFIPIHRSKHWTFVCVDTHSNLVECYDPFIDGTAVLTEIADYLRQERAANRMKCVAFTMVNIKRAVQDDGCECGTYICMYARNRIFGACMPLYGRSMYEYRLKMAHELMEGEIIYSLGHCLMH